MEKHHLYFAFGSNLFTPQMQERCPKAVPLGRAVLPHFELCFPLQSPRWEGCGVAGIRRADHRKVKGLLYILSLDCLKILDDYECHPIRYKRQMVFVYDEQGKELQAWTYFPVDVPDDAFFAPSKDYLKKILQGAYEHKFPRSYLQFLHSIPTAESESVEP